MRRYSAAIFAAAIVLSNSPAIAASKPNAQLIQKIDHASASFRDGKLTISAKGAVSSGGWENPQLKLLQHKSKAATLVVEFRANPPAKNLRVIQALLPVSAVTTVKAAHGVTNVRVVSKTNSVTVTIEE